MSRDIIVVRSSDQYNDEVTWFVRRQLQTDSPNVGAIVLGSLAAIVVFGVFVVCIVAHCVRKRRWKRSNSAHIKRKGWFTRTREGDEIELKGGFVVDGIPEDDQSLNDALELSELEYQSAIAASQQNARDLNVGDAVENDEVNGIDVIVDDRLEPLDVDDRLGPLDVDGRLGAVDVEDFGNGEEVKLPYPDDCQVSVEQTNSSRDKLSSRSNSVKPSVDSDTPTKQNGVKQYTAVDDRSPNGHGLVTEDSTLSLS